MRILVLSDLWPPFPGGAERLMFNLARHLSRRGHDVQVVTGYAEAQRFDGPPVDIRPIGVFDFHKRGARQIRRVVDLYVPDVVVTHHIYAYEFEKELAAAQVPVVQVVLNTRRLDGAALAVYISQWVRATLGDSRPQDLVVTPPAFDDVVADTHGDAIGFVKPVEHKGVDLVYRIAAAMPDRRFLILRGEWQTLEDIRPAANIAFAEPVADIRDFWSQIRLVLMPSLSEDAGTVAQEAAVNGVPCISSDVGGLVETNGGIRLAPLDLAGWLSAIRRLDSPAFYDRVVRRQSAHYAAANHADQLARFADAVAALVPVPA